MITFVKKHFTYVLLYYFPLLFFVAVGYFIIPSHYNLIREICNLIIVQSLFFVFPLIFKDLRIRSNCWFFGNLLVVLLVFIKLTFYSIFQHKISASALFVIFETNTYEASEFLGTYLSGFTIFLFLALLAYLVFLYLVLFKRKRLDIHLIHFNFYALIKIGLLGFICCAIYLLNWKLSDYNLIINSFNSYQEYVATKAILKKNLAKPTSTYVTEIIPSENSPKVTVIIVGESTSTWHMQLYGYDRNTNPLLSEIQDELLIYKDVITPHVHTILALEEILTFSSSQEPSKSPNASAIQLSNQANFKTYWLSNQRPVGLNESIPTLLGSAAEEVKFLATDDYNRKIYDEAILPELDKALAEKTKRKKVIFLHLQGTHLSYDLRYPSKFNHFKGKANLKYKHEKAYKLTNDYDNAVLYNDFIVREIIEKLRKKNIASTVLYFSDHGDDVYQFQDTAGHNEYLGSAPMYEVPFILWISEEQKKKQSNYLTIDVNRKYSLDEFIYSFADLLQLKFKGYKSEKSIFNKAFTTPVRYIKEGENYDQKE